MESYTEVDMQYILPYWDIPKWSTKLSGTIIKELARNCYANGAAITTMLGGGDHRMIGDLMPAMLYGTVSGILFIAPTVPVLTITPNITHSQLAPYEC